MSLTSSGLTHVRYGHGCRARDLEVVCPRCSALAKAHKPSEKDESLVVGDLSPSWGLADWVVVCSGCPFRAANLRYRDLPPCYWCFDVGSISVWAWNRDHLVFIRRYLQDQAHRDDPFAWLGAYVPGEWKANADRVCKAIANAVERR